MKKAIVTVAMLVAIAIASGLTPGAEEGALGSLLKTDAELGKTLAAGGIHKAYPFFMADDSTIIAAGKPLIAGEKEIRAFVAQEPERRFSNRQVLRAGVSGAGDLGYTSGAFEFSTKNQDGTEKGGHGVYLLAWKKQRGEWKVAALVENGAQSAPNVAQYLSAQPALEKASRADIERARAEIIRTDSNFSALSEAKWPGEAFATYIAADGSLLFLLGIDLKGKAVVREAFGEKPSGATLVWKPVKAEMSASCDLGFTIGSAVSKRTDAEGKLQVGYTQYLTVWKKQPDGSWKFVLDGGNPAPAPK
jgi:ketosteroid isomerase-like protein